MKKNIKLFLFGRLIAGLSFFYFMYLNLKRKDLSDLKYACTLLVLFVFLAFIIATVMELYRTFEKIKS